MGGWEGYKPMVAMIGMQCIYAGLALFSRGAFLQGTSPRVFVAYRQAIATLLMTPIVCFSRWRNPCRTPLGLKGISLILLSSFVGVTANQNAYYEGLYLSSSTIASAMANLIPAITFVLAAVVGFEKVNVQSLRSIAKIVGTVICVGGAICMALVKGTKLLNTQFPLSISESIFGMKGGDLKLGCLFLLANCCCASFWVIIQVPISARCPDHLYSAFLMCFMGAIQSAIFAFLLEHDLQVWNVHSNLEFGSFLFAGIGTGLSFFVLTWCISVRGPLYVAMFNPLCTVITTIAAAMFLHEELYIGSLAGAIAVIIGLYVVLWGKAKDLEKIKQETDSKRPSDTIQVLRDISQEKTSCKIDLEEPLLQPETSP